MTVTRSVSITDPTQIGEARRLAVHIAQTAGFGETDRGAVGITTTELATNLSRYATAGRMFVQAVTVAGRDWIEILAADKGPGMEDVGRCLSDGYSTGGTAGTGLGAVKRLASEFDIHSQMGLGTAVVARIGPRGRSPSPGRFQCAGIVTAAPYELLSGDAWRIAERDGELAVMVADGLGHGPEAAAASALAGDTFDRHGFDGPERFFDRVHAALAKSRGAAVALAHVATDNTLMYAGVGNISGSLVSPGQARGLMSQNGTAGLHMRPARAVKYVWPEDACLVMHSDGLTNRWSLDAYPGLLRRHPSIIAAVLHRDFFRGRDDATVVVVKRAPFQ